MLKASFSQQLDYWLQLCYPSDVIRAAHRMDTVLWQVLQVCAGARIPRVAEGHLWDCVPLVPVTNLVGRSFQEWLVRQPVRYGGFGVRMVGTVAFDPSTQKQIQFIAKP